MRLDHIIVFNSYHKNHFKSKSVPLILIGAVCHCVIKCADDQEVLNTMGSFYVSSNTMRFTIVRKLEEAFFKCFD